MPTPTSSTVATTGSAPRASGCSTALRVGFWAGIQPRKIEDSYRSGGKLGYRYVLSANAQVDTPPDIPKGW